MIATAALIAWTGLAHAQTGTPAGSPAKKEAPKAHKMEAELVKMDAAAKTIEVKDAEGKTETLSLSEKHKVRINGQEKTLADLKAGEKVHLQYYEKKDGTKSVSRIVVGEEKAKETKKSAE